MQNNLKSLRKRQSFSQSQLAELAGTTDKRISAFETGELGPTPQELVRLETALCCRPGDLHVKPYRPRGGQPLPEAELLAGFRKPAPDLREPEWTGICRLRSLRQDFGRIMGRLDPKIRSNEPWERFLQTAESHSRWETLSHLFELERGARPCRSAPTALDFSALSVVNGSTLESTGHHLHPALVCKDWLWIPQVTVLNPNRGRRREGNNPLYYSLDGLLLVLQPKRTFLDFEIDGEGHDGTWDEQRRCDLKLPEVRMKPEEILSNLGLSAKLRLLGYLS